MLYDTSFSITFINDLGVGRNTWYSWGLIPSSRLVMSVPGVNTKFVSVPGREDQIDLTTYLTGSVVRSPRSGSFEFYADNTAGNLTPVAVAGSNTTSTLITKAIKIKGKDASANIVSNTPGGKIGCILPVLVPGTGGSQMEGGGDTDPGGSSGGTNHGNSLIVEDNNGTPVGEIALEEIPYATKYNWQAIYDDMVSFMHGKRVVMFLEEDPEHGYSTRVSVGNWSPDANFSKVQVTYAANVNASKYKNRSRFSVNVQGLQY